MSQNQQQQSPNGSQRSSNDPALQQMAADLQSIRRKQSIDFYAPGIALILLVVFAFWFFGRP
jgi:hypothetical protein